MKRVLIESPYAGDVENNIAYARKCMRDSRPRSRTRRCSEGTDSRGRVKHGFVRTRIGMFPSVRMVPSGLSRSIAPTSAYESFASRPG